jgi:hypothetical protein
MERYHLSPTARTPLNDPFTEPGTAFAPAVDTTFNPEIDGGVRGSYSYVVHGMHLYAIRNINEPDGGSRGRSSGFGL